MDLSSAFSGDRRALRRLCTVYSPRLRAYFLKRGVSHNELDDALQETLTRMLDALSRSRISEQTFEGWLFTTARNVSADILRAIARRPVPTQGTGIEDIAAKDSPNALEIDELRQAVRTEIARLSPYLRTPIVLRHQHDLSYRGIASRLGISENAVGLRLYRARRILQQRLSRYY